MSKSNVVVQTYNESIAKRRIANLLSAIKEEMDNKCGCDLDVGMGYPDCKDCTLSRALLKDGEIKEEEL